ncbi:helix-turn-helix domain-containing protein [Actinomadura rayongensis]|uniref:Helix-turn-helix domain-containing protein n=1 Tax=Actinomadura rayongensis TaxID=1429076 RepID=A0A6I4WFC0_9ACTN|nr:helix-turn-helix domain-containing protein [Actinomadura rayongensis]
MKQKKQPEQPTLYTPAEVAQLFRVDPKTVTRWAKTGTLHPVTLPSGHRRYRASEIHKLLDLGNASGADAAPSAPSGRALAVLHGVVRDYFDGDVTAVVDVLSRA